MRKPLRLLVILSIACVFGMSFLANSGLALPTTMPGPNIPYVNPNNDHPTITGQIQASGTYDVSHESGSGRNGGQTNTLSLIDGTYGEATVDILPLYNVKTSPSASVSQTVSSYPTTVTIPSSFSQYYGTDPSNDIINGPIVYANGVSYGTGKRGVGSFDSSQTNNGFVDHSEGYSSILGTTFYDNQHKIEAINNPNDGNYFYCASVGGGCYYGASDTSVSQITGTATFPVDDYQPGTYTYSVGFYMVQLPYGGWANMMCGIQSSTGGGCGVTSTHEYSEIQIGYTDSNGNWGWHAPGNSGWYSDSSTACYIRIDSGNHLGTWNFPAYGNLEVYEWSLSWTSTKGAGNYYIDSAGHMQFGIEAVCNTYNRILGERAWSDIHCDYMWAQVQYSGSELPTIGSSHACNNVQLKDVQTGNAVYPSVQSGYNYFQLSTEPGTAWYSSGLQFITASGSFSYINFNIYSIGASSYESQYVVGGSTSFHPNVGNVYLNTNRLNLYTGSGTNYGEYIYGSLSSDSYFTPGGTGTPATFSFKVTCSGGSFNYLIYKIGVDFPSIRIPFNIAIISGAGYAVYPLSGQPTAFEQALTFTEYVITDQAYISSASVDQHSCSWTNTYHETATDGQKLYDVHVNLGPKNFQYLSSVSLRLDLSTDATTPSIVNAQWPISNVWDTEMIEVGCNCSVYASPVDFAALEWKLTGTTTIHYVPLPIYTIDQTHQFVYANIPASTIGDFGQYTIWYYVEDGSGNYRTSLSDGLNIFATAPTVNCVNATPILVANGTGTFYVNWSIWDGAEGFANVSLDGNQIAIFPLAGLTTTQIQVSLPLSTPCGTYQLNCTANRTDLGLKTTLLSTLIIYQAPQFEIAPDPITDVWEDTGTGTVTWKAVSTNPDIWELNRNNTVFETGTWTSGTTNTIVLDSAWVDAQFDFNLTVFDAQGYSNSTYFTFKVWPTSPQVSHQSDFTIYLASTDILPTWSCKDSSLDHYRLLVNTTDQFGYPTNISLFQGKFNATSENLTLRLDGLFTELGTYHVYLLVYDSRGHVTIDSFYLVVAETPASLQFNLSGLFVWMAVLLVAIGLLMALSRGKSQVYQKNKRLILGGTLGGLVGILVVLSLFNISPFYAYKLPEYLAQVNTALGSYGALVLVGGVAAIFVGGYFIYRALLKRKAIVR